MIALEWAHVVIGGVSAVVGAAGGLITGVWRIAHIEQDIRKDFSQDIAEAVQELSMKISESGDQFDETLRALRQKINDVELNAVKYFLPRDDFDDFRKEYREDVRDLKNIIGAIPRLQQ